MIGIPELLILGVMLLLPALQLVLFCIFCFEKNHNKART